MTYFNAQGQGRVGWKSGVIAPTPVNVSSLWTSVYAVYNADAVGSSSLKTSLYAAYNGESNANDSFGTNNGTAVGGLTYTTGKIGNAFTFNGTNSYVSLPNTSGQFNFTGNFSISGWIYITNLTGEKMIFSNSNGNLNNVNLGYAVSINNSKITVAIFENTGYSSYAPSATISTNQWYHFTITKTLNQPPLVYLNSTLQTLNRVDYGTNTTSRTYNPVYTTGIYPTSSAAIGVYRYNNNSTSYGLYPGNIDAVNVWNKELTQSEITELYNSGNGAQYITDSFYKPTTSDALNTYNGTAQGGLTYGVGKVGTAFQFNGTTAYVSIPNNSLNLTGDFTISAWVYPTAGTPQSILDNLAYAGGTVYKGWQLDINNISGTQSYKVTFTIGQGPGGSNYTGWEYSTTALTPNAWNHILIKRVSGVNTYCWVNNISQSYVLYGTGKDITLNPTYHTTQYNTIGSYKLLSGAIGSYLANGSKVDGVTVWNRALTDDERTQIYNSGNGKQYPN